MCAQAKKPYIPVLGVPDYIMTWYEQLQKCMDASNEQVGTTWAQLATVRGDSSGVLSGRPANRTINVRKFNATGVWFVSDLRSGKADDVLKGNCRFAELCWYFSELKMQFRMSGSLQVDTVETAARWAELTPDQRAWWALPKPGSPINEATQRENERILDGDMPPHFCVFHLLVDFVDLLDQKPRPMRREQHSKHNKSGEWSLQLVYP